MKIVVLVKVVPDTYGDRKLNMETGLAERNADQSILDEIAERAIEVALRFSDAHPDTEVILVTMAPASASAIVRKGLAMGASRALHIADEALLGADLGLTSEVLAAAARHVGFDVIITGNQSTDGSGGVIPAMLAERLGLPHLTALMDVEIGDASLTGSRASDAGIMGVAAPLPAVISITEALPSARFSNIKGVMAAKKKPYETLGLSDLGVVVDDPGMARSIMIAIKEKPAREAGIKITDEGTGGDQLADFLVQSRLV